MWPDAANVLPAAFADGGVTVVAFRPHSVEPSGGGYLYGYEVDTVDRAGLAATVLTYIDTDPASVAASRGTGATVVTDSASGAQVRVWAYPADPALPALAAVTYPERVVTLLRDVGIDVSEPQLTVAAYRPGKRAVIRVDTRERTLFLKVVRPTRAEPIAAQHAAFTAEGLPVPAVLAVRPDGLLVLERVHGVPAGGRVIDIADRPGFVPCLARLGEAVARVHLDQPAQADALDNAGWHRRSLASSLPDLADRVNRLYDEIEARRATWGSDERQVVHGDLHLEQLFVDPEDPTRITGLLDIDTAGWGHPARDAGALVAHLVVTAQWHRGNGENAAARACERIADDVVGAWMDRFPAIADRLPPTIASQLLAHAGGQATLGTEIGRAKAIQLVEATEGTLWPRVRQSPGPGSGAAPTV
ncbi:phosphotransferase enzyme family protein [Frondihabitans australicus]|uniref:phosphotransferase enzyme family protein n=1 Tax=Frondihabitans australicus TaxID=386892 RepID=UPI0011C383CC|nr:aminoglycoside phosphotransferase family protein [Frondihabitans australicus]